VDVFFLFGALRQKVVILCDMVHVRQVDSLRFRVELAGVVAFNLLRDQSF
jgi:hypothetical protein